MTVNDLTARKRFSRQSREEKKRMIDCPEKSGERNPVFGSKLWYTGKRFYAKRFINTSFNLTFYGNGS